MNGVHIKLSPFSLYFQGLTQRFRWITHPITIFVTLQVVWLAMLLMWVIWFVGEQAEIAHLAESFGQQYFDSRTALIILIVGCVLLGMLLVGTIILFVFGQRQSILARQKSIFVSSVTHELKSPLASLQLAIETLESRDVDLSMRGKLFQVIQTDLDRLKRLVDQILVAGRLDKGTFGFKGKEEKVVLKECIDKVCSRLTHLDPDLRARVKQEFDQEIRVTTSEPALNLIFTNLLENAAKYSPRGVPIVINIEKDEEALQISISDQGMGFAKKDRRRIFKMFHRAENAMTKAVPGTGLGLFIVMTTVKFLGGKIWAESQGCGRGARFIVVLPCRA
jgi:signal transduction histidine kinase